LEDNYFASRNAKLAPKFTGPHRILALTGECNVVLKMAQFGRKVTVNVEIVDRIKPYHAPIVKDSETDPVIPTPIPALPVPPKRTTAVPPPILATKPSAISRLKRRIMERQSIRHT
jgi:hypothetical protein